MPISPSGLCVAVVEPGLSSTQGLLADCMYLSTIYESNKDSETLTQITRIREQRPLQMLAVHAGMLQHRQACIGEGKSIFCESIAGHVLQKRAHDGKVVPADCDSAAVSLRQAKSPKKQGSSTGFLKALACPSNNWGKSCFLCSPNARARQLETKTLHKLFDT